MELLVHDKERGLLRVLSYGERLNWTLDSGNACDAVHWLDQVKPLIGKQDVIFDIGANMGVISNWFSQFCATVHAFEPYPENIDTIKSQIALRNVDNITLHSIALGKENTNMHLHVKSFHGHHSLGDVDNSPTVKRVEVQVRTVDDIFTELEIDRINFMKIDVEGFESDVIQGALKTLTEKKVDYILFEIEEKILHSIQRTAQEVFQNLFESGYQIIDLYGNLIEESNITNIKNGDYLGCIDGLATAKLIRDN